MNSNHERKIVMTPAEVSAFLKIPRTTLYDLVKKGKIRAAKVGKHWRFLEEDVLIYLRFGGDRHAVVSLAAQDRRLNRRVRSQIAAHLMLDPDQEDSVCYGYLNDIGVVGAFFVFRADSGGNNHDPAQGNGFGHLKKGDGIRVRFVIPRDFPVELDLRGTFVHGGASGVGGAGIQFNMLSIRDRNAVERYVASRL